MAADLSASTVPAEVARVLFGFGHLIKVMAAVHSRVDADTVETRIKYLQRLPFPMADVPVGKGGRTYYSADELMRLVAALELIAAGIVPAQAAGAVNAHWPVLGGGLAAAWLDRLAVDASSFLFAQVEPFDNKGAGTGHVEILDAGGVRGWLLGGGAVGRRMRGDERPVWDRRGVLVDLLQVSGALDAALSERGGDRELIAMREAVERWSAERGNGPSRG